MKRCRDTCAGLVFGTRQPSRGSSRRGLFRPVSYVLARFFALGGSSSYIVFRSLSMRLLVFISRQVASLGRFSSVWLAALAALDSI